MSKLDSLITVEYHKQRYTITTIKHSGRKLPILLDRQIYKTIKRLNKKWYINDKNHIYCIHHRDDSDYQVYLHDVVMRVSKGTDYIMDRPIIHINNIHFDNRLANLQFDIPNKNYSKNTKKKKRTISLKKHGINVDQLPTYMWYLKPDKTHGGRFTVEIPNELFWRSTASKKVSLKYKLEEAKKFLRHTKQIRPDIFSNHSMNGDMTGKGLELYREYHIMIEQAGFTMDQPVIDNTDLFLLEDTKDLTNFELFLLYNFNPNEGSIDVNRTLKDYEHMMSTK